MKQQLASATPVSIGVIPGEAIRETRGHHPSEIVNRTPGVYVSNFGGEGHATAIRQPITTKALYAYLEDGVPIRSTGFFNHNALYEINIPQAGRLEVIKGPGTAVYGSDAVGGVVNAFTRDPSPTPEAEVFLEGGSSTYLRGLGTASTTVGRNGFRADVNVTRADGWRDGTPYDRQSGTLRWDYTLGERVRLKTIAALTHVDQPGDGGSDLTTEDYTALPSRTYSPIAFRRVMAARLSTELQVRGEASSFGATLYTRYNELDLLPSWQLSFDPQVWESRHRSVGLLTRYRTLIAPLQHQLQHRGGSRVHAGQPAGDRRCCPSARARCSPATPRARSSTTTTSPSGRPRPTRRPTVALPGRVQLSAGARYDRIGYDYDEPSDRSRDRLPTGGRLHRRVLQPHQPEGRRDLGAGTQRQSVRLLSRGIPRAVREPAVPPGRGGEHRGPQAGARARAGRRAFARRSPGRSRSRPPATACGSGTTSSRSSIRPTASGSLRTRAPTNHRGVELGAGVGLARGLRLDGAVSYAKHTYVEWQPRPGVDYTGNEMELAPRLLGNGRLSYRPPFSRSGARRRRMGQAGLLLDGPGEHPTSTTATTFSTSSPRCR